MQRSVLISERLYFMLVTGLVSSSFKFKKKKKDHIKDPKFFGTSFMTIACMYSLRIAQMAELNFGHLALLDLLCDICRLKNIHVLLKHI